MSNSLIEIPSLQWAQLRDLYSNKKEFASCFGLLQNFIDWQKQSPQIDVTICSLNGEWEQDGTFVAKDQHYIYFNTLNESQDRLIAALNCLDPTQDLVLAGFQGRLLPAVLAHFIHVGLTKEDLRPEGTVWYHLPKEQAAKFEINAPGDIVLKPVSECHVEQINNAWPHRTPTSDVFLGRLICYNNSVGAFDIKDDLIAWCLLLPLGSLGVLHVTDAHKRRGLGSMLVRYMSKWVALKGLDAMAPVIFDNTASRSMFEKLGFKIIDKVYWALRPGKKAEYNM